MSVRAAAMLLCVLLASCRSGGAGAGRPARTAAAPPEWTRDPEAPLVTRYEAGETYLRILVMDGVERWRRARTGGEGAELRRRGENRWHRRSESVHEVLAVQGGRVTAKRVRYPFWRALSRVDGGAWGDFRQPLHGCTVRRDERGPQPVVELEEGEADDEALAGLPMDHPGDEALLPERRVLLGDRWTPDLEALLAFFNVGPGATLNGECVYRGETLDGAHLISEVEMALHVAGRSGTARIERFDITGEYRFDNTRHRMIAFTFRQEGRLCLDAPDESKEIDFAVDWRMETSWDPARLAALPLGYQQDPRREGGQD